MIDDKNLDLDLDLETDFEEIEDLEANVLDVESSDKKEFTYADCIRFSQEKSKAISAYHYRSSALNNLLKKAAKANKLLDPNELLLEISKIDFKYPIV